MTSVEYDLDSSGGLMAKIQALIAPPESEESAKNKKKEGLDLHPYFKRPGKGHNRDCCDSCNEGGNLICCDKCPASFHLTCHDPPLEETDIPLGQWLCHCCRLAAGLPSLSQLRSAKVKEEPSSEDGSSPKEDATLETLTRGEKPNSMNVPLPLLRWLPRPCDRPFQRYEEQKGKGRSRSSSATANDNAKLRGKPKAQANAEKAASTTGPAEKAARVGKSNPMELLVAAASSMNPRQFELPREMLVPIIFPGTDKVGPVKPGNRRASTVKKKQPYELDNNGLVPLPAKLCYECQKSCRKAPLVACDYCPLFFHMDCVDPPLTAMPTGRWMCPNHHQQLLEEKTLTSVSVTERVRLWDLYSGPVDPDAVKTEFFRKVRRRHPPFRFKVQLAPRARVRVPNAIREHYRVRPQLIPSLHEVLRQNQARNLTEEKSNLTTRSTEEEQEVWLSSVVALQTSIACHMATQRKRKRSEEDNASLKDGTISNDETLVGERLVNGETKSSRVEADGLHKKLVNGDGCPVNKTSKLGAYTAPTESKKELKPSKSNESSKTKDVNLSNDPALVESLVKQLESSLDGSGTENILSKLDNRLIGLLALQRLRQLTAKHEAEKRVQPATPSVLVPGLSLRPRALLTPVSGSQPPLPLYYRVVEIGSSRHMDVCLSQYGHCNFISSKHSVIICDEVNKHYELMNYSEHGTTVDNVLYSCDFSEKWYPSSGTANVPDRQGRQKRTTTPPQEVPPLIQRVREVVGKRRRHQTPQEEAEPTDKDKETLPAAIGKPEISCNCRTWSSSVIGGSGAGWEGTAILNHGSYIKFGCIQFTFSISSCAPCLPPPTNHYAPLTEGPLTEHATQDDCASNSERSSCSGLSVATKHTGTPTEAPTVEELPAAQSRSPYGPPGAAVEVEVEVDADAEDDESVTVLDDTEVHPSSARCRRRGLSGRSGCL